MITDIHGRIAKSAVAAVVLASCGLACGGGQTEAAEPTGAETMGKEMPPGEYGAQPLPSAPTKAEAQAELQTVAGVTLEGKAQFVSEPDGVRAIVEIDKATPGKHGIHVHQKGDCSDIAGKSMGTHFTPEAHEHGLPTAPTHHLGDLGNIEVAQDGKGKLEIKVPNATLDQGPSSFLGKALVIHAKEDVGTGPSGESGDPIACGVIQSE